MEQAYDFFLRKLALNPMLLSPFSWISMRTRNTLDDLKKASIQSRQAVCQRIVYESATTKAQIITFLNGIQDLINGAFQTLKIDEETKSEEEQKEPV